MKTINRENYTIINETDKGILLAPINKRTRKPRTTGNIMVNKETGDAFYMGNGHYIGKLV